MQKEQTLTVHRKWRRHHAEDVERNHGNVWQRRQRRTEPAVAIHAQKIMVKLGDAYFRG